MIRLGNLLQTRRDRLKTFLLLLLDLQDFCHNLLQIRNIRRNLLHFQIQIALERSSRHFSKSPSYNTQTQFLSEKIEFGLLFENTSKRMLENFTQTAMKWIKPFKRFFQGEGKMMGTLEDIRVAYYSTDAARLYDIMKTLKENRPYFWSPHYQKTAELIALCQMLLATNQKAKEDARWRLSVILDTNHELGRRILEFIGEMAQLPPSDFPEFVA